MSQMISRCSLVPVGHMRRRGLPCESPLPLWFGSLGLCLPCRAAPAVGPGRFAGLVGFDGSSLEVNGWLSISRLNER